MYGVPADLDMNFLVGAELIQVCLGQIQIQFHFLPKASISVEGSWKLIGSSGTRVDRGERDAICGQHTLLARMLGHRVTQANVVGRNSIVLRCDNGDELHIFDDSAEYESFSLDPIGIVV